MPSFKLFVFLTFIITLPILIVLRLNFNLLAYNQLLQYLTYLYYCLIIIILL